MANQIMTIAPYWYEQSETWVFDDPDVRLDKEPFISGIPEMIDDLVADIPNPKSGFRMLFSAAPFPGFQRKITRLREEMGGWYQPISARAYRCPRINPQRNSNASPLSKGLRVPV